MHKADLEKAYQNTIYSVCINEDVFDIRINESLPLELNGLISSVKSAAFLTAWNPRSELLSETENKKRNIQLRSKLQPFITYESIGQSIDEKWAGEESFFILDIDKASVEQLAVEFEQFAYVWCVKDKPASLLFTDIWKSYDSE